MKVALADSNVILALLYTKHTQHAAISAWFDELRPKSIAICRFVQLTSVRLLGTRTVMGVDAKPASAAWSIVQQLQQDDRVLVAPEPAGLDDVLPTLLKYPTPTPKLINDAYLAAFAIAGNYTLTTLDRGFQDFESLDLHLLA